MKSIGFALVWLVLLAIVVGAAFYGSRGATAANVYSRLRRPVRLFIGLVTLGLLVAVPVAVVLAAGDRVPGGAGTYVVDSSQSMREGRTIFREACASCHSLTAAGARGVTGPNLDIRHPDAAATAKAVKIGGTGQNLMPAGLLDKRESDLVARYVAAVAGK